MTQLANFAHRRLSVEHLGCRRGERSVLAEVSISAVSGETLLLRGENGAGKSSLLMCLAGLIPYEGKLAWEGVDPELGVMAEMHFISHLAAIKPDLTVEENLDFWARLNGGDPDKIPAALIAARLDHAAKLPAGVLSAGQTRRLSLLRLLVAPRPIWLLDEPTAALDAQGAQWVKHLIDSHVGQGGMTIVATHLELDLDSVARTYLVGGRT